MRMMLSIPADVMGALLSEAPTQISRMTAYYDKNDKTVAAALEKSGAAIKQLSI